MPELRNDIHDRLYTEIEGRISSLQSGAPAPGADEGARTQTEVDAELSQLASDQALLLSHWRMQDGAVASDAPVRARACGKPQPCPHVLELAQKYGYT